MNGHQRWYCKECGHIFVRHYALSNEVLYTDYLFGKQTIQQLSVSYHLSARQIQRRLHHVENQGICHSNPRPVAIQMDATYWATDNGLLVIKDAHRGDVLWRKFLNKKETVADYMEGVYDLCSKGYTVIGAVADGLRGLRQALGNIPFQYCQFHAIRFVRIQLTTRPKTIPGQQLSAIANGMAHTDKESFEGALSQWFEQWRDYINERTKSENGRSFFVLYTPPVAYGCIEFETEYGCTLDILYPSRTRVAKHQQCDGEFLCQCEKIGRRTQRAECRTQKNDD